MVQHSGQDDQRDSTRVLVVVPTYQERDNLGPVLARLSGAVPHADVLVVDDGSPDGTGQVADALAASDPRVSVMHRREKGGLGAAYLAGFAWGHERDYDVLVEMDADGSHPPETLPRMLEVLSGDGVGPPPDLVIGSRWVPGGRVVNWPRRRELLSRAGNAYVSLLLRLGIRDATAGFRAYRAESLWDLDLDTLDSRGYCFQVDMAMRAVDRRQRVVEIPIVFREREFGVSKMGPSIVAEAMLKVTGWGVRRRLPGRTGRKGSGA